MTSLFTSMGLVQRLPILGLEVKIFRVKGIRGCGLLDAGVWVISR